MKSEKEIREEIEVLREELNNRVANTDNRMPDSKTMELSKKMDELLNELNLIIGA